MFNYFHLNIRIPPLLADFLVQDLSCSTPWCQFKVPNFAAAVDARAKLACYPRGNFYPISSDLTTKDSEDH